MALALKGSKFDGTHEVKEGFFFFFFFLLYLFFVYTSTFPHNLINVTVFRKIV